MEIDDDKNKISSGITYNHIPDELSTLKIDTKNIRIPAAETITKRLRDYLNTNNDYIIQGADTIRGVSASIFSGDDFSSHLYDEKQKVRNEVYSLQGELKTLNNKIRQKDADHQIALGEFKSKYELLEKKQQIVHISSRIMETAALKLLEDDNPFIDEFKTAKECNSVVVSIDIRRSTELMLKARTPEKYSEFITGLSDKLSHCIIENYGIFDKFTGDGILAFFPDFYSGEDAILRALKAAQKCHEIFTEHYILHKNNFNVFIKDIGLGIGIDYGQVTLVNTNSELTVVGIPVVYACRFSGANAGTTLLNIGAFEELYRLCPDKLKTYPKEINIKNEGMALAYSVDINEMAFVKLREPKWLEYKAMENIEDIAEQPKE